MEYREKSFATETIYQGKIVNLRIDDVVLHNGNNVKREIIEHSGAVAILPIAKDGEIFLVKQFRKPIEEELIELPAGKLEEEEDPKKCAIRELEEEIGYKANKIKELITIYTSPGFANEIIYIYVADELEKTEINRDEDEFMDVLKVNLEKAKQMIYDGDITDAKTIVGILTYLQKK